MNRFSKNHTRSALFLAIASTVGTSQALAQMVIEEVIVTATKRETALMDTAAAVTAFDSNSREELGIETALDLAAHTPSLTIAPSRISIRGVGRPNLALGSDPGVGIYWDGVYTTENDIFNFSQFLDIDRLEVLRGPQGTLYGRNSIGGAVNFVSTKPYTDEWGGKVVGQVGNEEYWVAQGLVSGPITDTLSVLAAASTIQRDGFQKNVDNGKKYDDLDRDYWTISLASETTDRWSNSIKVMDTTSDYHQDAGYILSPYSTDPVQEVFNTSAPFEQTNFVSTYPGTNFANPNQGMTRENPALNDENDVAVDTNPWTENSRTSATFISEYDFDSFSVKYTLGYTDFKFKRLDDADVSNAADSGLDYSVLPMSAFLGATVDQFTGFAQTPSMIELPYRQDNKTWSHELQFTTDLQGDFNYIAGLYYYDSDEDQFQQFIERNEELMANYTFLGSLIGEPTSPDGTLYRGEGNLKTTSYAAYGQMNWDWSESTVVTLGLRYSYDEKEASDNTFVQWVSPDVVIDPNDPTVYREDKKDWDKVTWRIGVDHLISDDHFVYGFAASGYRSGGYNLLAPTTSTELDTVNPEELISYEIGYKGSFMEKRLNLTTALYYYDYDDLQVLKSEAINGVTVATFENAADATAWGLETELTALLTDQLMLSGTYSYNSTEYDNYDSLDSGACTLGPLRVGDTQDPLCTDTQDLSGNEFPLSPENKLAINLIYSWELLAHDWSAMVSYQYTDDQWLQSFNDKNYDELESYDRWDARLNLMSPAGTWEATAFVNNISDDREEIYRARPSPVSGLAASSLTDPRTYGLKVSYNF